MIPPSLRSWILILGMSGLIVLFWFVAGGVALRYLVRIDFISILLYVLTFFLFRYSLLGSCHACIAYGM